MNPRIDRDGMRLISEGRGYIFAVEIFISELHRILAIARSYYQ